MAEGCASIELLLREPLLAKRMAFDVYPSLARHHAATEKYGDWFTVLEDRSFYHTQHRLRRDPDFRIQFGQPVDGPVGEVVVLE